MTIQDESTPSLSRDHRIRISLLEGEQIRRSTCRPLSPASQPLWWMGKRGGGMSGLKLRHNIYALHEICAARNLQELQRPNDRKMFPEGPAPEIRNTPLARIYMAAGVYDVLLKARPGVPRFYPHSVHLFENGNSAIFIDLCADRHTTTSGAA